MYGSKEWPIRPFLYNDKIVIKPSEIFLKSVLGKFSGHPRDSNVVANSAKNLAKEVSTKYFVNFLNLSASFHSIP